MKFLSKLICVTLLSTILFTGCVNKKDVVIKINDDVLTRQEYEKLLNTELEKAENKLFAEEAKKEKDSDGIFNLLFRAGIVDDYITKYFFNKECEKRKIKVSEKELNDAIKNITEKLGSKEKFNQILKQSGVSVADFKRDMENELKMSKLVDSLAIINITDDMAKNFYNENIENFKYPDKVRAAHILVSADPDRIKAVILSKSESKNLSQEEIDKKIDEEMNKKYDKAVKILAEVKNNPSNFTIIAKNNSDDPGSAQEGGDLGYFAKDQMDKPFADAAFSMKPGTVSDIVRTRYGYHIIFVKDRVAAGSDPYEKVKDEIKLYLKNKEKINVLKNCIDNAKNEAKIEYVDPGFNPKEIQDKIQKLRKTTPMAKEIFVDGPQEEKK